MKLNYDYVIMKETGRWRYEYCAKFSTVEDIIVSLNEYEQNLNDDYEYNLSLLLGTIEKCDAFVNVACKKYGHDEFEILKNTFVNYNLFSKDKIESDCKKIIDELRKF